MMRARRLDLTALSLALACVHRPGEPTQPVPVPASVASSDGPTSGDPTLGVIEGVIRHASTGEPLADAIVILQCTCLPAGQERLSTARGVYRFTDLPPGSYTLRVSYEKANVSKVTRLPRGAKFRANFSIEPNNDEAIEIIIVIVAPAPVSPDRRLR